MHTTQAFFWCLSVVTFLGLVHADDAYCEDSWLFIDIHYRVVDARNDSLSYGLFIGAGTSSQNQSLWPSLHYNETRLASNDFCTSDSPATCNDPKYTHGHFGPDASLTWTETPQYASLDFTPSSNPYNTSFGHDDLNMFTHYFDPSPASKFVVENHTVEILSDYRSDQDVFFNSGSLGLGPASSILSRLVDIGRIRRKVFGMYLGTAYPRAGGSFNGSVVFGGFDAGRIAGDAHKYPLVPVPAQDASAFKVHVKQMTIVTADGSTVPLVTDGGFDGYLSTSQYTMELPQQITEELSNALGASPAGTPENALQLAQKFNGNLTITLDDGYQITYPSEWVSNVSNMSPFSASTPNANTSATTRPLIFGTAFLHHLYMTVDYEDSSFYLADAKVDNNYVQPESLCVGTAPAAAAAPKINKFLQTGMIGAIIGGLIGGMGVSFVIFYCIRKRLQRKQSEAAIRNMEEGGKAVPRKSSLRKKSMFGIKRLMGKTKNEKEVKFGNVKRLSWSGSDSSDGKGVTVTVSPVSPKRNGASIEMRNLGKDSQTRPNVNFEGPISPITPPGNPSSDNTRSTNITTHPRGDAIPSALPTPYAAETPRTANPLLGDFRGQWTQYDDNDDSDLNPNQQQRQHRTEHQRSASEALRNKLGLSVNTNTTSTSKSTSSSRPKPAPLPIKPKGTPYANGQTATTQSLSTDHSKRTGEAKKYGVLRKVFPAS